MFINIETLLLNYLIKKRRYDMNSIYIFSNFIHYSLYNFFDNEKSTELEIRFYDKDSNECAYIKFT